VSALPAPPALHRPREFRPVRRASRAPAPAKGGAGWRRGRGRWCPWSTRSGSLSVEGRVGQAGKGVNATYRCRMRGTANARRKSGTTLLLLYYLILLHYLGTAGPVACDPASSLTSRSTGRTEKNLLRHGAQRSAGKPKIRPRMLPAPRTWCGEIRCSFRLPQTLQWA
jgi:hypothetical protein